MISERIKKYKANYYLIHKKELSELMKEYYLKHKEQIKERSKEYRIKNKEKIKNWEKENKDHIRTVAKKYLLLHQEEIKRYNKAYGKQYRKINKNYLSEQAKIYNKNRRRTDIDFRILHCLRQRIYSSLKLNIKSKHTLELIGCSLEFLKQYLESQFKLGMTWNNYGDWHVDHIIPCCTFDLSIPEEQRKCFNYTNLRPLWAKENLERPKRG